MQEYRFEFAADYGKDEGIDFSNNRFINAAIYRSGVGEYAWPGVTATNT